MKDQQASYHLINYNKKCLQNVTIMRCWGYQNQILQIRSNHNIENLHSNFIRTEINLRRQQNISKKSLKHMLYYQILRKKNSMINMGMPVLMVSTPQKISSLGLVETLMKYFLISVVAGLIPYSILCLVEVEVLGDFQDREGKIYFTKYPYHLKMFFEEKS